MIEDSATSVPSSEFIPNGPRLHALTTYSPQSVRQQHSDGRGPLSPILTKFGGRLGVWLADWQTLARSQRKLPASMSSEAASASSSAIAQPGIEPLAKARD